MAFKAQPTLKPFFDQIKEIKREIFAREEIRFRKHSTEKLFD